MAIVKHVLKNGTILDDITGHVVKIKDAEPLYQLMDEINRSIIKKEKKSA